MEISKQEQAALDAITKGLTMGQFLRELPSDLSKEELQEYAKDYDQLRRN